jgi:hypothetical protein
MRKKARHLLVSTRPWAVLDIDSQNFPAETLLRIHQPGERHLLLFLIVKLAM